MVLNLEWKLVQALFQTNWNIRLNEIMVNVKSNTQLKPGN